MEAEFTFETFASAHRTDTKGCGITLRLRQNHTSDVCCYCGLRCQSVMSIRNESTVRRQPILLMIINADILSGKYRMCSFAWISGCTPLKPYGL